MRKNRKVVNLFEDKNVFSVKYVISIADEDDLNEFWHLVNTCKNTAHDLMHDFLTKFYNFTISYLQNKKAHFFEIIIEESEDFFYFTIWNRHASVYFKDYLETKSSEYKCKHSKLSFKLNKCKLKNEFEAINKIQTTKEKEKSVKEEKKKDLPCVASESRTAQPYTFIEYDDLEDMIHLNDDMQDLMHRAKKSGFTHDLFISLRSAFSMFCLTIKYYSEISHISNTISEFSHLMITHQKKFLEMSKDELMLVEGFVNNIERWLYSIFIDGGNEIDFMDNSLKADYETIHGVLACTYNMSDNISVDNIFDF